MPKLFPLILFSLLSCRFTLSPYEAETPKLLLNEANMQKILLEEPQAPPDFKIALISDTHNYYDDLDDQIKKINTNGPYAFVVVLGDLTNQGLLEEFKKTKSLLDDLNFPYLTVVGNHDLLSNGNEIFDKMFGPHDFSLIYKNAEFIFFNNNNWEAGGPVPNTIFIESKLMASISPVKILLAHVSPDDKDRFSETEIESFKTRLTTYGVDYIINGHNHNPAVGSFSSSTQITVGAPSKRAYFELIFSAGGVTHQKISF